MENKKIVYANNLALIKNQCDKYVNKMKNIYEISKEYNNINLIFVFFTEQKEETIDSISTKNILFLEFITELQQNDEIMVTSFNEIKNLKVDAYFGDYNLKIFEFLKSGIPVIFQDIHYLFNKNKEDYDYIQIQSFVEEKEQIYFIPRKRTNYLLTGNLKTKETKIIKEIEEIKEYQLNREERLFLEIKKFNDKIICVPYGVDSIKIYHILEQILSSVEIPKVQFFYNKNKKFTASKLWKNELILIPEEYPYILRFNVETYKFTIVMDCNLELQQYFPDKTCSIFKQEFVITEHDLYLLTNENNLVLKVNIETGKYTFYHLGDDICKYQTITYDGIYFWLTGNSDKVIRWDEEACIILNICYTVNIKDRNLPFVHSYYKDRNIYLVSKDENQVIKLNVDTFTFEEQIKQDNYNFYETPLGLYEEYADFVIKKEENYILKEVKEKKGTLNQFYYFLKWIDYCKNTTNTKLERKEIYHEFSAGERIHNFIMETLLENNS